MLIETLVREIARDTSCRIFPAGGIPHCANPNGTSIPADMLQFYNLCGGLVIGQGSGYEVRIVPPGACQQSNNTALGDSAKVLPDDISWQWYNIADIGDGDYLSVDLSHRCNGWCYDSFQETYGLAGEMPIIARSFIELLSQLYAHRGQYWYWLQPTFLPLGDAYDAMPAK